MSVIGIRNDNFSNFVSDRGDKPEGPVQMEPWLRGWEKWVFVNPDCLNSREAIKFGDKIGIKNISFHHYLSGRGKEKQAQVLSQPILQSWEIWSFEDVNCPSSTANVTTLDDVAVKNIIWDNYLSARGSQMLADLELQPWLQSWEKCHIIMTYF